MIVRCLQLILLLCLLVVSQAVTAAPVQFQVNLGPYLAAGYLDPTSDQVEVRGDFNGWSAGPHLLPPTADGTWHTTTLDLPPGDVAYKFVIVRSGGAVVWEDHVANRTWTVPQAGGAAPLVFFDDMSAAPAAPIIGADLSHAPRLTSLGATYSAAGQPADLLSLLAATDHNLIRLRLWHSPDESWQALEATIDYAQQVAAAGFDIMLDLHYSDTWADPGHQTPPAVWQGLDATALTDSIAAYTGAVVAQFTAAGVDLRYLQIGNEIDGGILWDEGRVGWPGSPFDTPLQWSRLTTLLQAAAQAARANLPPGVQTELILHLATGGDNTRCRWFLDQVTTAGVDFDVIGLSFYPWWHGSLWDLDANLRDLGPRYAKSLLVVETAYPWTLDGADATGNFVTGSTNLPAGYPATPRGQLDFLRDVRRVVESAGGLGVVTWEPAFLVVPGGPPNPHENLTLFDFAGDSLPGLDFGMRGLIATAVESVPAGHQLAQNRPNPFNPTTDITYRLAAAGPVSLKIYNLEGRLVRALVDTTQGAGEHTVHWSARDEHGQSLASGVYFYELTTVMGVERRKMVLVK